MKSHTYPHSILAEDGPFKDEKWDMGNVGVTLLLTPAVPFSIRHLPPTCHPGV